jgi:outer membrane receptor for ferrienterochelin and colicin
MKRLYLIIAVLLFSFQVFAIDIDNVQIAGNLIDENENTVAYANVLLENIENGEFLGAVSDENGHFKFGDLSKGNYKLKISYIGFKSYESTQINLTENKKLDFANIQLFSESVELSEVIVTGKNIISEIKPTKITYKTEALISQLGGNAGDILKNMPSVSMGGSPGHNRDIRFRGLGNGYTKVLINGKEAGLKGNNHEAVLDQIPAGSIKSIEILSVPGAEFNSEGINGIVNIVLKDNNNYGTHGNAELYAGNFDALSGGVSINHKTEKLSLFAQYDFQQRTLEKNKESIKTNYKDDVVKDYENKDEMETKSFNNRFFSTCLDYYLLPKTKFSAEYIYGYQLEDKSKSSIITKLKNNNSFKSSQKEMKSEQKPNDYHRISTSLKHTFENYHSLEADFSYLSGLQRKEEEKATYNIDETGRLKDFQPKLENKYERRTTNDYSWGISLKNINYLGQKLSIGYAGISEINDFSLSIDKYNYSDTSWHSNSSGYDNFHLNYNNHAWYITDEFNYKFFRLVSGIRYEYTKLTGNTQEDMNSGNGNYGIFLPNVSLTTNIDKSQYLIFNLGRRIRRPGYKDLNPYVEEKEVGEFKQGNPDLMPEIAWAYEIGYFKKLDNFNFGTNLFYRDINDVIQKTKSEDLDGNITEMPQNTGSAMLVGIELMSAAKIFNFWEINVNYSQFYSKITSGEYKGDALKDQFRWSAKAINDFILPYKTKIQFAFNAIGPKISNEKKENTIWFADFGIQKELTNNSSIVFRVSDLFNSLSKEKTEYTSKTTKKENESAEERLFTLGLRYNF